MEDHAGSSGMTLLQGSESVVLQRVSRLSRRRQRTIAVLLTVVTAAIAVLSHLALREHWRSQKGTEVQAAAIAAVKACLAATQPSDAAAIPAIQRMLDECSTGDFKTHMAVYGAVLSEAYHAENVHVQPPEIDAAVEHINDDGSIIALAAFRTNISQAGMPDRYNSYRIRVLMMPDNGTFKIAKLEQVIK